MTTTTRKLKAQIVLSYLECDGERTAGEIGNAVSMKKREVEDAIWLLMNGRQIEYGEHRAGAGLTYRVAAVRER